MISDPFSVVFATKQSKKRLKATPMDPETGTKVDDSVPQEAPLDVVSSLNTTKENDDDDADLVVNYNEDDRRWAKIAHLAALCGVLIPFGGIVAPIVVWKKKEDNPFIVSHAKEALEFQINLLVLNILAFILAFVVIGALILPLLAIANIVLSVVAGMRAQEGKHYEYPWIVRVVKYYKLPARTAQKE